MKPVSSRFASMPGTQTGWLSVGLTVVFTILFFLVTNDLLMFSGFLTIALGAAAGLVTLYAVIGKGERSWVMWLMLIPGLFAILFALGEILLPH